MNNKVKSFTLSEILVVIIITVIVIGLAFTVLNLVKKQTNSIERNYERISKITFLKQSLWIDFNKYETIEYNSNEKTLFFKSELDSITYLFDNEIIIQNIDTLKLNLKIDKVFFEGNEVQNGIIDGIRIFDNRDFENQSFFIFKRNDASTFVNQYGI